MREQNARKFLNSILSLAASTLLMNELKINETASEKHSDEFRKRFFPFHLILIYLPLITAEILKKTSETEGKADNIFVKNKISSPS